MQKKEGNFKMTLYKSVEAARTVLQKLTAYIESGKWDEEFGYPTMIKQALATLPEQPMSEDDITKIITDALQYAFENDVEETYQIILALRAANVLYVKE